MTFLFGALARRRWKETKKLTPCRSFDMRRAHVNTVGDILTVIFCVAFATVDLLRDMYKDTEPLSECSSTSCPEGSLEGDLADAVELYGYQGMICATLRKPESKLC